MSNPISAHCLKKMYVGPITLYIMICQNTLVLLQIVNYNAQITTINVYLFLLAKLHVQQSLFIVDLNGHTYSIYHNSHSN